MVGGEIKSLSIFAFFDWEIDNTSRGFLVDAAPKAPVGGFYYRYFI